MNLNAHFETDIFFLFFSLFMSWCIRVFIHSEHPLCIDKRPICEKELFRAKEWQITTDVPQRPWSFCSLFQYAMCVFRTVNRIVRVQVVVHNDESITQYFLLTRLISVWTKFVWLPLAPKETNNIFLNTSIPRKNTSNIHNICYW